MNKLIQFFRQLSCTHPSTTTITNFGGDYIDRVSTPRHIYRSEKRCTYCGKKFYSEYLDSECNVVNYIYLGVKIEPFNGNNKGCETDRKRICYSRKGCTYAGEKIDDISRKCNAYEMSEGHAVSCSGLYNFHNENK